MIFMEMTFGKAHDIWSRVISGDSTLTEDEVKAAAKWFDDFSAKLSDKASQSEQELQEAIQSKENKETIERRKREAAESDKRQLEDFINKYDDLINWLKARKVENFDNNIQPSPHL